MYRVEFRFDHEVQRVSNEVTIPQNNKVLQSKLLLENGKGSYNGKSMHSEPSLSKTYYTYMIQQTSDFETSLYDHDRDIVMKGTKQRAKFSSSHYDSDRKMAQIGAL